MWGPGSLYEVESVILDVWNLSNNVTSSTCAEYLGRTTLFSVCIWFQTRANVLYKDCWNDIEAIIHIQLTCKRWESSLISLRFNKINNEIGVCRLTINWVSVSCFQTWSKYIIKHCPKSIKRFCYFWLTL